MLERTSGQEVRYTLSEGRLGLVSLKAGDFSGDMVESFRIISYESIGEDMAKAVLMETLESVRQKLTPADFNVQY